jgi:hypothetical protein
MHGRRLPGYSGLEIDGSISVMPAGGTTTQVKRPVKCLKRQ